MKKPRNVVMSRDEEHGPDGEDGEDRVTPVDEDSERPVHLVRRGRRPDLALKIVKTAQALSADDERSGPPPPGVITVGGVNEAKAYVPAMRPAAGAKPKVDPDSQRVRIVDSRKAPTVQLDQKELDAARRRAEQAERGLAESEERVEKALGVEGAPRVENDVVSAREARGTDKTRSTRVLLIGIAIGVLIAAVPVVVLLLRTPPPPSPEPVASSRPAAASASPEVTAQPSVSSVTSAPQPSSDPSTNPSMSPSTEPSTAGAAPTAVVSSKPSAPPTSVGAPSIRPKASGSPKASSAPSTAPTRPPELVN